MRWKSILLYGLGLFLLLFGNSDLWEKLKAENTAKKKQLDSLRANEDAASKFEVQKVFYDSISGKWLEQPPTYHPVHIKKQKKVVRKKKIENKTETHALGLGTCPLGTLVSVLNLPANQDILRAIHIPENYEVAINVALGYPDEIPVAPQRYPEKVKIIQ